MTMFLLRNALRCDWFTVDRELLPVSGMMNDIMALRNTGASPCEMSPMRC